MAVVWDLDFRVTYWSARAETVFRRPAEDVLGLPSWEWMGLSDKDQRRMSRVLQQLVDRQMDRHIMKLRHEIPGGTVLNCDWYLYAVSDDGDAPHAIEGIVRCVPAP
jgi:PAS domain-containing protein